MDFRYLIAILGALVISNSGAADRDIGTLDKAQSIGEVLKCGSTQKLKFSAKNVKQVSLIGEAIGGEISINVSTQGGSSLLSGAAKLSPNRSTISIKLNPTGPGVYFITLTPNNCKKDIAYKLQIIK
jgi:hypothetical protein